MSYRIDFELVNPTTEDLKKIQTKINQWLTSGSLIKYKHTVVGDKLLFEFCRKKED